MKSIKRLFFFWVIFSFLLSGLPVDLQVKAAWRDPVRGKHVMVASQSDLASKIGADIIKRGGNAVDAAVAVGLALAVTYPEAGNLGGGGFMLIRFRDGRAFAIDYREMAPRAATRDVFVDKNGNLIKGEGSSTIGYRASGVPGTPAGLELAFKKYGSGKIKWADLVEPSRKLAQDGFTLSNRLANLFKSYEKNLSKYADSKRIFLNNGKFFGEGDVLKQPELAQTLARMQQSGARDFYEGETARLIAADMRANKGLITLEDLKNYKARERAPLKGTYRGHEIITMPPPSSGGIVLLQALNMLEKYDVRQMGWASSEKYHLLTEVMRRSFADRAEYMADPDFAEVPVAKLIDKNYAATRAGSINPARVTPSAEVRPGELSARREPMDTTHYTVVDADGNVVTNTYTINDLYGSAVTAKGTGVLLNDEMDDFAARPGQPNMFGLVQGERNKVEPGKRPLSSMTPTIVLRKDGSLWFALGARGGPRIITSVLQATVNMIDYDMNIQQAIDAPRVHHQWLPDEMLYEPLGMSTDTIKALQGFGHKFAERPSNVAQMTAIAIEEKTNVRLGAIDSRGDGEAVGY